MSKILIVDDDEIISNILATVLEKEGYTVKRIEDGKYAVRTIKEFAPDLVLLDIFMKDQEGIGTLFELKSTFPSLIIVMISSDEFYGDTAVNAGANCFLKKPISNDKLIQTVSKLLQEA